eukprot:m.521845 g.521845  ORF g.521845 m.521845 type:complete len:333 (+) comp21965_c0_seq1:99-1097(+)
MVLPSATLGRAIFPIVYVLTAVSFLSDLSFGLSSPTAGQLEFQDRELAMFMHFSMCTFAPNGGCEQDTACRSNPPSLFNPSGLNTTQWMQTAVDLGAKQICLTAHHTGGFALWNTNVTDYGIKESPWMGGKGDIVKEFTDSCREFGISPCLYFINDWDCWESNDTAPVYVQKQLDMLTELLTKYGTIDRLWFDFYGAGCTPAWCPAGSFPDGWAKVVAHVRKTSPSTLMLPGPDGCENPSESGDGIYPVINYINDTHPDTLGYDADRHQWWDFTTINVIHFGKTDEVVPPGTLQQMFLTLLGLSCSIASTVNVNFVLFSTLLFAVFSRCLYV